MADSVDHVRCSFFAPREAKAYWSGKLEEWSSFNRTNLNSQRMVTSGGRKYTFGPDYDTVMHDLMGFILSESGVKINQDHDGHYVFSNDKTRYVLYYPPSTFADMSADSAWFFNGCARVYGSGHRLLDLHDTHRFQAVIVSPCDIADNMGPLTELSQRGVVVLSSFEKLRDDLAQRWKAQTGTPIFDYCIAWDSGLVFYTCQKGNRHFLPSTSALHDPGGELITASETEVDKFSSLLNKSRAFFRYESGDTISLGCSACQCGRGWLCNFISRRDEHLWLRSALVSPTQIGADPPPGIQIFQDSDQRVSVRYDDEGALSAHEDAVGFISGVLQKRFGEDIPVIKGRIRRGSKTPGVYSLAVKKSTFKTTNYEL